MSVYRQSNALGWCSCLPVPFKKKTHCVMRFAGDSSCARDSTTLHFWRRNMRRRSAGVASGADT